MVPFKLGFEAVQQVKALLLKFLDPSFVNLVNWNGVDEVKLINDYLLKKLPKIPRTIAVPIWRPTELVTERTTDFIAVSVTL